jgi:hypothetical protein
LRGAARAEGGAGASARPRRGHLALQVVFQPLLLADPQVEVVLPAAADGALGRRGGAVREPRARAEARVGGGRRGAVGVGGGKRERELLAEQLVGQQRRRLKERLWAGVKQGGSRAMGWEGKVGA